MKRVIIISALAVGLSSLAPGQASDRQAGRNESGSNGQAEREVRALEDELVEAGLRGDAAATDRLIADDYLFMTRDGVVHENLKAALLVRMKSGESKTDVLARLKPGGSHAPTPHPTNIADAQVHVYGDTGVVVMRSAYVGRGRDGRVIEVATRFMHVWVRRHGRWQLVAGSSTRIAPPKR